MTKPTTDSTSETYLVLASQNGKPVVFRQFTDSNSQTHQVITRVNADGSFDPGLNVELAPGAGSRLQVREVAVQADGQLLAVVVVGNAKAATKYRLVVLAEDLAEEVVAERW